MRQIVLVAAVSAAVGAGTAVVFSRPEPPGPVRAAPALDLTALEAALVRALERARLEPAQTSPDAASTAMVKEIPTAAAPARRKADEVLPPPDAHALESVSVDPESRRTWLFRSEGDVIAWLGTPDEIVVDGGSERWQYNLPGKWWLLYFHQGRLIGLQSG